MRLFSRLFLLASIFYALCVLLFVTVKQNRATAATDNSNVVISQIQIAGAGKNNAGQEFVELYNPTSLSIDLTKWNLTRESSSSAKQTLVSSMSGSIKPHGYFLIGSPSYATIATVNPDLTYSATGSAITDNNAVVLYNGDPNIKNSTAVVVDKVGMGLAIDNETADFPTNPSAGGSIIRKATADSTAITLSPGGSEVTFGNGFDTDNNATDFVLLQTSMPRNSASSAAQPRATPTPLPTNTPTPTNIPTPTPTNTPTPTLIPTATPTATPTPTIVTATPTPTPTTETPTPTTEIPTQTPTPTQTVSPSPTLTPTPTPPNKVIINNPISATTRLVCMETTHVITILGIHLSFPSITCQTIKS